MTITVADMIAVLLLAAILAFAGLMMKRTYDGRMSRFTLVALCGIGAMQICFGAINALAGLAAYLR